MAVSRSMPMNEGSSSGDSGGAAMGGAALGAGAAFGPWGVVAVAALQVWSGLQQAEMIEQNARLNQQIAEMNAQFAEADAFEAEKFGFTESARYQSVIDSTVADQQVAFAAQNVDVNYGTAGQIQAETKLVGVLNILDIQKRARQKAAGYKREAANIRLGGQMGRTQASIDASAVESTAIINAGTTVASGYGRK